MPTRVPASLMSSWSIIWLTKATTVGQLLLVGVASTTNTTSACLFWHSALVPVAAHTAVRMASRTAEVSPLKSATVHQLAFCTRGYELRPCTSFTSIWLEMPSANMWMPCACAISAVGRVNSLPTLLTPSVITTPMLGTPERSPRAAVNCSSSLVMPSAVLVKLPTKGAARMAASTDCSVECEFR